MKKPNVPKDPNQLAKHIVDMTEQKIEKAAKKKAPPKVHQRRK